MESIVASFEETEFPQVLLIQANELNADLMPELLAMFRRRGYTFVTLQQAPGSPRVGRAAEAHFLTAQESMVDTN